MFLVVSRSRVKPARMRVWKPPRAPALRNRDREVSPTRRTAIAGDRPPRYGKDTDARGETRSDARLASEGPPRYGA